MLSTDARASQMIKLETIGIKSFDNLPFRRLNFPDKHSWTDHAEITNTNLCYLIAAGNWCEGCTAVNPQDPEEAMTYQGRDLMPRIDPGKVIEAHEALKAMGINFITDMGGENLTIPGYATVVESIAEDPVVDGLVYSSSMYFLRPDGTPNQKFAEFERAGLFSGAMYFLSSVDRLLTSREQIPPNADGSYPKAYAGLKLIEWLVNRGYGRDGTLGIHMVIRRNNIDQIRPLYEWAGEHGVPMGVCDLVYVPYTSRRKNPVPEAQYADHLREEDMSFLQEQLGGVIEEEAARIKAGGKRILIPSSAFLRMSMTYGPENKLNCRDHRGGRLPNTFDVHPSGQVRACIAQNTVQDVHHCDGCAYISIDRGQSDYAPFEIALFGASPGDMVWRNYIVNRKHPTFRPDRKNLAFIVADNGLPVPYFDDVEYYDRDLALLQSTAGTVDDGREGLRDENYYASPRPGNILVQSATVYKGGEV